MDTSSVATAGRRQRRRHRAEFKAAVIQACQQPGVSIAAIALANGLNASRRQREHAAQVGDRFGRIESRNAAAATEHHEIVAGAGAQFIALTAPAKCMPRAIRTEVQWGEVNCKLAR